MASGFSRKAFFEAGFKQAPFNRETYADERRFFNRATRAIKRYVIPLARVKKINLIEQ
jgi:hypothetical protein